MCIDYFFKRSYDITPPKTTGKICWLKVYNILQFNTNCNEINLYDEYYKTAPKSEFERMIDHSIVDKGIYSVDYHDCDDYSFALKGEFSIPKWSALIFGLAFFENHVACIFIDDKNNVWLVEPQSDEIKRANGMKFEKIEI